MRRAVMRAALAAVLLATGAAGLPRGEDTTRLPDSRLVGASEASDWREDECRYGGIDKGGTTPREVRWFIGCATSKWPVPGGFDKAIDVAMCETGGTLDAHAYNEDGCNGYGCLGVFQQHARYWPGRQNFYGPVAWDKPVAESGFNGRANVVVSIRMVRAQGSWDGWACA